LIDNEGKLTRAVYVDIIHVHRQQLYVCLSWNDVCTSRI